MSRSYEGFEEDALCSSPIACAVADAWAQFRDGMPSCSPSEMRETFDALELATRESPLRKVHP